MAACALSGITVLDLGQAFMGPYCGLLMQRLGADVIKVEPPQGEPYRRPTAIKGVEAVQFGLLNAGKRSLCIDLKQDAGRRVFTKLASTADVIIQNFAPGAFDRLVGVDDLLAANSRLIIASGSGYGSTGPRRDARAMDLTIQALAGVMATTGFPDSAPVRTGPAVADFMGGAHLFGAVMAALVQRGTTGRGQHVEVALYDAIFPSLASNIGGYFDSDGEIPERTGNRHGGLAVAPYNAYRTADGWIAILCLHDRHWGKLCRIMGRQDLLDDERLSTNSSRVKHMDLLDRIVEEWTLERSSAELEASLGEGAIPNAPVQSLAEVLKDPQIAARGMFEQHHNADREWWTFGSPLRLSDSPPPSENVPPRLGQHTLDILRDKLMLSQDQIGELTTAGAVVGDVPAAAGAQLASDPVI
jgi:crotonobetainyl-CoA:carnitine CoA-transferase CaiB-like acyl-CoA transferase